MLFCAGLPKCSVQVFSAPQPEASLVRQNLTEKSKPTLLFQLTVTVIAAPSLLFIPALPLQTACLFLSVSPPEGVAFPGQKSIIVSVTALPSYVNRCHCQSSVANCQEGLKLQMILKNDSFIIFTCLQKLSGSTFECGTVIYGKMVTIVPVI